MRSERQARHRRSGFSLIELLVVLAVTALLAATLFPAFRGVRETAHRLACASNMRQIGLALTMYSDHNNGALPLSPYSSYVGVTNTGPRDLTNATLGSDTGKFTGLPPTMTWAGLGLLLGKASGGGNYLETPAVLYSPSYRGIHTYERYRYSFDAPQPERIVTNYHYCGHTTFSGDHRRAMTGSHDQVLLTSGLRTVADLNQRDGTNVLRADCTVTWFGDSTKALQNRIRTIEKSTPIDHPKMYEAIWKVITEGSN